jgi:pimeloyl-[acyl-carrier protein] methyl ester esterase
VELILLPGMNGTAQLFQDVLEELEDIDTRVIALPQQGPQDYESLSRYVSGLLPDEDYIILAESYSGGIAARLSQQSNAHLRGIIFVAAFISSPAPVLALLARFIPFRPLVSLPFLPFILRAFLLGRHADEDLLARFRRAVLSVPMATFRSRLSVIAKLRYNGFKSRIPAIYIGAGRDIFVGRGKWQEFAVAYPDITFVEIDGPHFLLQAGPKEAAVVIHNAIGRFIRS